MVELNIISQIFLIVGGLFIGLILLYVITRIMSAAILRSYLEFKIQLSERTGGEYEVKRSKKRNN